MPELPEVETTRRGLLPHLLNNTLTGVSVREPRLRWQVDSERLHSLCGEPILDITRRAKYLLCRFPSGTVLIHLGMSGSLRICSMDTPLRTHDHILFDFASGIQLRYHDPRRFGACLWAGQEPFAHALLKKLGPEPFDPSFTADYLHSICKTKTAPLKSVIMTATNVVGVGNIYACEALFMAHIAPHRRAKNTSKKALGSLVNCIQKVLTHSIEQGGTTLRDFLKEDGTPGYFKQKLFVYGRTGQPCKLCGHPIHNTTIAQRSSFYCPHCQK